MTLPQKPKSLVDAEKAGKDLEKKIASPLPSGKLADGFWEPVKKSFMEFQDVQVPNPAYKPPVLTGRGKQRSRQVFHDKRGLPIPKTKTVRKQVKVERIVDYKWNDPDAGERAKRAGLTAERNEQVRKLNDVNEMRAKWKRNPTVDSKDRPGSRKTGPTILTGGLGVYGKADTKKQKLG